MNSFEKFISQCEKQSRMVKMTGANRALVSCPGSGHQNGDQNPSLSALYQASSGMTLIKCQAGCNSGEILLRLGLTFADLFDNKKSAKFSYKMNGTTYRDVYRYSENSGEKSYNQKVRIKTDAPFLYRLDELSEQEIYLVEGEKDAETLWTIGKQATSAPMGALNFNKVDVTKLKGKDILAIVDLDQQGFKWHEQVKEKLEPVVKSLKFLQASKGHDTSDCILLGGEFVDYDSSRFETSGSTSDFEEIPIPHLIGDMIVDKYNPVFYSGTYYIFNGQFWETIDDFDDLAFELRRHMLAGSKNELARYLKSACTKIKKGDTTFDTITLLGGKCIKDGVFMDYDGAFTPYHINLEYDENVDSSKAEEYIRHINLDDEEQYDFEIQKIGYCLLPHISAKRVFIIKGGHYTGKSTFHNFVKFMLGKDNVSNVPLERLADERNYPRLIGKLANIDDDMTGSYIERAGGFKTVTSGNELASRKLGTNTEIKVQTNLTFMVGANEDASFADKSGAIERRIAISEYNANTYEYRNWNADGYAVSDEGRSAVMKLALQGIKILKENNYQLNETTRQLKMKGLWQVQTSNPLSYLFGELKDDINNYDQLIDLSAKEVYNNYASWCSETGRTRPGKDSTFFTSALFPQLIENGLGTKRKIVDGVNKRNIICPLVEADILFFNQLDTKQEINAKEKIKQLSGTSISSELRQVIRLAGELSNEYKTSMNKFIVDKQDAKVIFEIISDIASRICPIGFSFKEQSKANIDSFIKTRDVEILFIKPKPDEQLTLASAQTKPINPSVQSDDWLGLTNDEETQIEMIKTEAQNALKDLTLFNEDLVVNLETLANQNPDDKELQDLNKSVIELQELGLLDPDKFIEPHDTLTPDNLIKYIEIFETKYLLDKNKTDKYIENLLSLARGHKSGQIVLDSADIACLTHQLKTYQALSGMLSQKAKICIKYLDDL